MLGLLFWDEDEKSLLTVGSVDLRTDVARRIRIEYVIFFTKIGGLNIFSPPILYFLFLSDFVNTNRKYC